MSGGRCIGEQVKLSGPIAQALSADLSAERGARRDPTANANRGDGVTPAPAVMPAAAVSVRALSLDELRSMDFKRQLSPEMGGRGMSTDPIIGFSRRTMLGGLGVAAGAGVLGAALAGESVLALPAQSQTQPSGPELAEAATALQPQLRYVLLCGHDFAPLISTDPYSTLDGRFHFTATPAGYIGYASVLPNLPIGAVIKELEVYGTRTAAGSVSLELWRSDTQTGAVSQTASAIVPAVVGPFTTTIACDDLFDNRFKSTPFVLISAAAALTTQIFGMRVGYESPTGFTPLPTTTVARVYDSRLPGFSKLAPNEERTITLPVPNTGAAVLTLTLTETEGPGGFVSAFREGITWPGTSSINWSGPGQNIATTVVCSVSATSKITVRGGANPTHFIIDVAGWII